MYSRTIGVPLSDASIFPAGSPTVPHLFSIGTQWVIGKEPVRVTVDGKNRHKPPRIERLR